ncbi:uncharacterized protein cubi_02022 [Cryptosporidium ubiquitum]|uniref:Uncharacterized protein n=1 Tax=Cryptosporidium ubiquitum TaxID=857276 RepID=A0A1J4MRI1_9CRYT|nr:uncharacterized protein cubi_02022 [Cryptosporidium ubiquitum]OII75501.1 hypothetical protein cubi_02022 [Cryptosporidium ubiquitum]
MREFSDSEISEITEINSDDELPSDSIGDYSVISLKGILKEIISCGSGYEKPGIGDELLIELESTNILSSDNSDKINTVQQKNGKLKVTLGDHSTDEYYSTRKREIPWGIEMALRKMLKGEKSKILIKKGSVFSRPRDLCGKICVNSIIRVEDCKSYNNRSKKLINMIKKEANEFDVFTVTLHDFHHIEMICDNVNKKVWKKGVYLKSPSKKDKVELFISKLQIGKISENLTNSSRLYDMNSEFDRLKFSLSLDDLSEINELVKYIFGNERIHVNDFIYCILSMKLGEISEFRFYNSNHENISILIHLTGFYWEKNIQIKLPFNKEIQNNSIKLSSYESESLYTTNPSLKEGKLSSKRISSLNLDHNTRINILLEKFTLVDNNKGERIELSLPFKSTKNMKTALLKVTPAFYNLPIWLEQSILYCSLGGKYTIKIPLSVIFLFPPTEIQADSNIEIQKRTKSLIISENNNLSTLNSNACNENHGDGNLHAIWEAGKLIEELENMGYEINDNIEDNLGLIFELDLSICTRGVVDNYIPVSLSTTKMEFEYYYYLGNILNNYNDSIYKVTWNVLALEVFDKLLYVVILLPFYSKLAHFRQSNDVKLKLLEKENASKSIYDKNNVVNNKNQNQKLITLKYGNSLVEDISEDSTKYQADSIPVSQDVMNHLDHQEKRDLENLINVINIMLKLYYDMQQFEKCSNLLEKYKFLMQLKSNNSEIAELSALKNNDSNVCEVKDLN